MRCIRNISLFWKAFCRWAAAKSMRQLHDARARLSRARCVQTVRPALHNIPCWQQAAATALCAACQKRGAHQLRVHFAHIGHPMAGDDLYKRAHRFYRAACPALRKFALCRRRAGAAHRGGAATTRHANANKYLIIAWRSMARCFLAFTVLAVIECSAIFGNSYK